MAHKKAGGSSKNGRDSNPQYRGIKVYGGEHVTAGSILIRQVGGSFKEGLNVGRGRDFTLFAKVDGQVQYERFGKNKRRVNVIPAS